MGGFAILFGGLQLCMGIYGCVSTDKGTTETTEVNTEVEKLKEENEKLKARISELEEASSEVETAQAKEAVEIVQGNTITSKDMEIIINKIEFSYNVLPDDTSGMYTYAHYEAEEGNVYIHVDADVKNLAKQDLNCDEILEVMADYNNGYTYKSFATADDSTTGFKYSNIASIKPLETGGIHFLVDCPKEVAETELPLFLKFELDGIQYVYDMRNPSVESAEETNEDIQAEEEKTPAEVPKEKAAANETPPAAVPPPAEPDNEVNIIYQEDINPVAPADRTDFSNY